jgi:hypothetical protein
MVMSTHHSPIPAQVPVLAVSESQHSKITRSIRASPVYRVPSPVVELHKERGGAHGVPTPQLASPANAIRDRVPIRAALQLSASPVAPVKRGAPEL